MTFTASVRTCLAKCIVFSGSASRPEFWKFVLFAVLLMVVAGVLNVLVFGPIVTSHITEYTSALTGEKTITRTVKSTYGPGLFQDIVGLLLVLPLFAAAWRRMRDAGNPGIILLVPVAIYLALSLVVQFGPTQTKDLPDFASTAGSDLPSTITVPDPSPWLLIPGFIAILAGSIYSLIGLCMSSAPSSSHPRPNPSEALS